MLCFKNAQIVASVSIIDRAFHYGDGCFSTARIRAGQIELAALHLARLAQSCERLALNVDLTVIEKSLQQLKLNTDCANGSLKIIISRGEGQRGYALPKTAADIWMFYYPQDIADHRYQFIQAGIAKQRLGLAMPSLLGIKSLNRLEQVLLKKEADEHGWQEALVADIQGQIVEGVSSNCFMQINGCWICPDLRYNGVHGVMRAEILARMQHCGIVCEQRSVDLTELNQIQSLFFCNALSAMQIVTHLAGRALERQACIDLFDCLQLQQIH